MIFYFSATGNSKYVAEQIAKSTGDKICSITDFMKEEKWEYKLDNKEHFGIVTPTYAWELPIIVREFLEKLNLIEGGDNYRFSVATYGTTPGATGVDVKHILKRKGILLDACYSVQMPDTWTVIFDLSDADKVKRINEKADHQLAKVIHLIENQTTGNHMDRDTPYFVRLFSDKCYETMRKTKHFHVEDTCIGCGLCEKKCPVNAIQIVNGKPTWVADKCVMCLGCLHRCPKFSIHYGKKTAKHGQYSHPKVKI